MDCNLTDEQRKGGMRCRSFTCQPCRAFNLQPLPDKSFYSDCLNQEINKLKSQLAEASEALKNILTTEDHMAHESKWINYNTSHLRRIARECCSKWKTE
jgi:hypothetical protein